MKRLLIVFVLLLVLGGGGLKGLAHIGAWRALSEAGVRPAGIVGTSIGALVGGRMADRLHHRWRGGRVLVQTFSPEHPSIALAAKHDYLRFAAAELTHRHEHNYPPYHRLARLIIRGKSQENAGKFVDRLAGAFDQALKAMSTGAEALRLLGPAEAPVFRLKGYCRYHFQLQSPNSALLHEVLRQTLPVVRAPHGIDVTVDIDPQDML